MILACAGRFNNVNPNDALELDEAFAPFISVRDALSDIA